MTSGNTTKGYRFNQVLLFLSAMAALIADSYLEQLFNAGSVVIGLLYIAIITGAWLKRCKIRRKRHEDYVDLYVYGEGSLF